MKITCSLIAASAALAFADTTTVNGSYTWSDSLGCKPCTIEKVFIVKVPGRFELGSWDGGANDVGGQFYVNGTAGSLPVITGADILLHVTRPIDTAKFSIQPKKQGRFFVRFTADPVSTARKAAQGRPRARSPLPVAIGWGVDILGRSWPSQAPR